MLITKFASDPPAQTNSLQTRLQETVVTNKIEDLLVQIVALEARFETPPGELEEQECRDELIRYVIVPHSPSELDVEFFPASSRRSRANWDRGPRCKGYSELLVTSKTTRMC